MLQSRGPFLLPRAPYGRFASMPGGSARHFGQLAEPLAVRIAGSSFRWSTFAGMGCCLAGSAHASHFPQSATRRGQRTGPGEARRRFAAALDQLDKHGGEAAP
jgi:hypothetical protein